MRIFPRVINLKFPFALYSNLRLENGRFIFEMFKNLITGSMRMNEFVGELNSSDFFHISSECEKTNFILLTIRVTFLLLIEKLIYNRIK